MPRCKHKWVRVGTNYVPPSNREISAERAGSQVLALMERILSGFTTISLCCEICGDVGTRQVVGKWVES